MVIWLLVLIIVQPVLVGKPIYDPAIANRHLFQSIFASLFLLAFFLIKKPNLRLRLHKLTKWFWIVFAAFTIWQAICLSQAINVEEGLYYVARYFLHMVLVFIFMIAVKSEPKRLMDLCIGLVIAALLQTSIGIMQHYGYQYGLSKGYNYIKVSAKSKRAKENPWNKQIIYDSNAKKNKKNKSSFYGLMDIPPRKNYPFGFQANRNLLGSVTALLIPFAAFVFVRSRKRLWKIIALLALLMSAFTIVAALTRSAWISLIFMWLLCMIMVVLARSRLPAKFVKQYLIGSVAAIGAMTLLLMFMIATDPSGQIKNTLKRRANQLLKSKELGLDKPKQKQTAITDDATVDFVLDSTSTHQDSLRVDSLQKAQQAAKKKAEAAKKKPKQEKATSEGERLGVWRISYKMLKDNPMMGVGPGNWRILVPKYGTEGLPRNARGQVVALRPHNVYFQIADEGGFPGIALYLLTWALISFIALRLILRSKNTDRIMLAIFALASMASFAGDSIFSFPNERIDHSLFLCIAWGILLGLNELQPPPKEDRALNLPRWVFIIPLAFALFNVYIGNERYEFERYAKLANAFQKEGNNRKNKLTAKKKKVKQPTAKHKADWKKEQKLIDLYFKKSLRYADSAKSPVVTLTPTGAPLERFTALAYAGMDDLDKAIIENKKALTYHPNSAGLHNNIGTYYNRQERYDEAAKHFSQALEYTPKNSATIRNLAVNYYKAKRYQDCLDALGRYEKEGLAENKQIKQIRKAADYQLKQEKKKAEQEKAKSGAK